MHIRKGHFSSWFDTTLPIYTLASALYALLVRCISVATSCSTLYHGPWLSSNCKSKKFLLSFFVSHTSAFVVPHPLLLSRLIPSFEQEQHSSVQFSCSVKSYFGGPHGLQHLRPPCPSPTLAARSEFMPIESLKPSNHLTLCPPFLLLPLIFPSIMVFSNEAVLHIRWPKYWSFSFSTSLSNEYSGLISFRIDWWDFLVVRVTLRSFLQNYSAKASILWCSAFFVVQLSHPYMTTGKTRFD